VKVHATCEFHQGGAEHTLRGLLACACGRTPTPARRPLPQVGTKVGRISLDKQRQYRREREGHISQCSICGANRFALRRRGAGCMQAAVRDCGVGFTAGATRSRLPGYDDAIRLAPEHLRAAVSRREGLTGTEPTEVLAQEPVETEGASQKSAEVVGSPLLTHLELSAWHHPKRSVYPFRI
jgi:hypothetical protein